MNKRIKWKFFSFCLILLASILLFPCSVVSNASLHYYNFILSGQPGDPVPNPSVKVGELQDNAYTYTSVDCVVNDYGIYIDDYVTIVVIDDGLISSEWKALEQNPEAKIRVTGFLTFVEDSITFITNPDSSIISQQHEHGHGFEVLSVIASIAREVKVIFIDLKTGSDVFGFPYDSCEIWNWIDDNQDSKDIDIISCSWDHYNDFATQDIHQKWQNLVNKDVFMVCSAGNAGNYLNRYGSYYYKYLSYYSEWYSVGSIDHENRGGSYKDHKSTFSSWYEDYTTGNHIVNWLQPGNGIPIMTDAYYDNSRGIYRGTWEYGVGTSFSTPYLAAIAALVITGYHNGLGGHTDPSLQEIINILLYSSSRSTFDQKMGYGYVDAYLAYGKAYTEGRLNR